MLLHGAFLPPRAVIDEVVAVVRSVVPAAEEAPEARGLFGRRGRRRAQSDELATDQDLLEHILIESMSLPITGFGNLTTNDARGIAGVLGAAAREWPAPTVRFAGGTALEFPGDWNVWAKLTGEVDELAAIARGVTRQVEPLGFFVDRRGFRPMMAVAKVTAATTGPYLESIVAALEAFAGAEWVVGDVVLTTAPTVAGGPAFVEYTRIPLGS